MFNVIPGNTLLAYPIDRTTIAHVAHFFCITSSRSYRYAGPQRDERIAARTGGDGLTSPEGEKCVMGDSPNPPILTTFYLVNLGMEGVVYIEGEMIEPSTMQIFVPRLLTSRSAIPQ
jgi:hypothetical protein